MSVSVTQVIKKVMDLHFRRVLLLESAVKVRLNALTNPSSSSALPESDTLFGAKDFFIVASSRGVIGFTDQITINKPLEFPWHF